MLLPLWEWGSCNVYLYLDVIIAVTGFASFVSPLFSCHSNKSLPMEAAEVEEDLDIADRVRVENEPITEADLKEIERKIEEAAEPEGEEEAEDRAHAALMTTLDQVIDCLANSEASEEMISLGRELCRVVESIATPTVEGVRMTINPEAGAAAAAAAEPRPSTSRASLSPEETRPLRIRAHRVNVWIKQATKKAFYDFLNGKAELRN